MESWQMVQANDVCCVRLEYICCWGFVLSSILPGYEPDIQLCVCHFWSYHVVCYPLLVVYAGRGMVEI